MKADRKNDPLVWAIIAFCAWQALPLVQAWMNSPLNRGAWLAFLMWLTPVLWTRTPWSSTPPSLPSLTLSAVALAVSIFGRVLDVHALGALALALALAAPIRRTPATLLWFAGSLTWMPVFGWALQSLSASPGLLLVRLFLAGVTTALTFLPIRSTRFA